MPGQIKNSIQKHFIAGLLIFTPMALTIFLVMWLDGMIIDFFGIIPDKINPLVIYELDKIPGLGLAITLVMIYFIGVLGSIYFGKIIVMGYEGLLNHVPGVRWLYVMLKQFMEGLYKLSKEFHGEGSERFNGVVLVEYPRKGIYTIAFVTGDAKGEIVSKVGKEMAYIFIPTTPNPTSGFFLMVPKEDLTYLNMPVDQAFKLIVSVGMASDDEFTDTQE